MNSKPTVGAGELPGRRFKGCASFLEANGAKISIPDDRNFETEGEAIEVGLRRTIDGRDLVMRSLVRAATLVAEKKDVFGNAMQNLYPGLERAEDLVGPAS